MRPRLYFRIRVILIDILLALIGVFSLFALSFIVFSIRENEGQYLLAFGGRGWLAFAGLFPWMMLLAAIALLIVLEMLVRQFRSGYRFPALRMFLAAVIVGVAGGIAVELTPLHRAFFKEAESGGLPLLGPLYEQVRDARGEEGIYRGTITELTDAGFVLASGDASDDSWTVVPPDGFDRAGLSVGERVYAAGALKDGVVHAYGIRRISE